MNSNITENRSDGTLNYGWFSSIIRKPNPNRPTVFHRPVTRNNLQDQDQVLQFLRNVFSKIEHVRKYSWGKVVAANHIVCWLAWHFSAGQSHNNA